MVVERRVVVAKEVEQIFAWGIWVEPSCVVFRRKDHRAPVMDLGHGWAGGASDDAVFPGCPISWPSVVGAWQWQ